MVEVNDWVLSSECVPHGTLGEAPIEVEHQLIHVPTCMEVWVHGRQVDRSHNLMLHRGLFVCTICGAMGSAKLRLLTRPCPGHLIASGKKVISSVRQGRLPWGVLRWPADVPADDPIQQCVRLVS